MSSVKGSALKPDGAGAAFAPRVSLGLLDDADASQHEWLVGRLVFADRAASSVDRRTLMSIVVGELDRRDVTVKFLVTPARFVSATLPDWTGSSAGWATPQADFDSLRSVVDAGAPAPAAWRCRPPARADLSLAIEPRPPGVARIAGTAFWRLRVGQLRVVYSIDDEAGLVVVLRAARRAESTYRRLR